MVAGDMRAAERPPGGVRSSQRSGRRLGHGRIRTSTATVEEHVRGENARDMDAVMGTFSDSAHASIVYNGIPTTGHAKIRRSYEIRLNALPDFRLEVKQRHFSADSLIAEHVLHFTNKK